MLGPLCWLVLSLLSFTAGSSSAHPARQRDRMFRKFSLKPRVWIGLRKSKNWTDHPVECWGACSPIQKEFFMNMMTLKKKKKTKLQK